MAKHHFVTGLAAVVVVLFSIVVPTEAQRKRIPPQPGRATRTGPPVAITEAANDPRIWVQIYGARVFRLYQDTREPEVIYATTPVGLYKTTDKGFRWKFVFAPPFPDPSYPLGNGGPAASLIFSQSKNSPNVMFLGANWGENGDRWPTIWKSENSGESWNDASAGVIVGNSNPGQFMSDILISPNNPSVVYMVFGGGPTYKTLNGGKSWGSVGEGRGLSINASNPDNVIRPYAESSDGGVTWNERKGLSFDRIMFHPANPKILFGRTDLSSYHTPFVSYSISEDEGRTWTKIAAKESTWCLAFSDKSDQVIYAGTEEAVYISQNRGKDWQKIFDRGAWSLAVVGSDTIYATTSNGIWKTSNGGNTWHRANFMLPMPIRHSEGGIAFDRLCWVDDETDIIYVGGRGGYWTTTDGGFNWQWNSIGTNNAQVMNIKVTSDRTIFVGAYDRGTWGSDKLLIRITPQGKRDNLGSFDSEKIPDGWPESLVGISTADSRIIYRGTRITEDSAFSWRQMNVTFEARHSRLIVSPVSPKIAYVLVWGDSGGVLATTDGGNTWKRLSMTFVPVDLVPDPKEAMTVYTINLKKLYRSRNGGENWDALVDLTPLGELVEDYPRDGSGMVVPLSQFAVNPLDPSTFYLKSRKGFWESRNSGRSWHLCDRGFARDGVERFVVSGTKVLAQGSNGIYRLSDDKLSWAVERWDQYEKESRHQEELKDPTGIKTSTATANNSPTRFRLKDDGISIGSTWSRIDSTTWVENNPNGHSYKFRVVERARVDGVQGTLLRRSPDNLDIFIPDMDSGSVLVKFRVQGNSQWRPLREMVDVERK